MQVPQHIAIIMDGNGRWARSQGKPRTYGHKVGAENLVDLATYISDIGVKYLTVYAFSTENWKRSVEEVGVLMNLFGIYLKRCQKLAIEREMKVTIIGDKTGLSEKLQSIIEELERTTAGYTKMWFQIAVNYGGRDEILRAVEKIARDAAEGNLPEGKLSEEQFEAYLDTAGVPDPDLLIRTSGEQRLSNYLLWQLAYSEYYFTDVPWPALTKQDINEAIEWYFNRDRRFGGIAGQSGGGGLKNV